MRINPYIQFQPFKAALADLKIEIDGVHGTLSSWLEEFNFSRGSCQGTVNGVAWRPYALDEITRDDLATEFAFEAYSEWDGTGEIDL
jgi:hypothetical protein